MDTLREDRPEHTFKKLRFFNCYNPLVMQEILDHKLDFLPRNKDTGPFILDTIDQASRRYVADLNGFYFHKLNALGKLISEGQKPLETLDCLKALHDLLKDEWYSDFLTAEGIFEGCLLYVSLEKKESLMVWPKNIDTDIGDGYPAPDLKKYKAITGKYSRMKDHLLYKTFEGIIKKDTAAMSGLGFPNPWREAVENRFTDSTLKNAEECLRNRNFLKDPIEASKKIEARNKIDYRLYRSPMKMNEMILEFKAAETTIRDFMKTDECIKDEMIITVSRGLFRYKTSAKTHLMKRLHKKFNRK